MKCCHAIIGTKRAKKKIKRNQKSRKQKCRKKLRKYKEKNRSQIKVLNI